MMGQKFYTEDDLRSLFGQALEVMREGLTTGILSDRCSIAADFLRIPLTSILMRGQQETDKFPLEIEPEKLGK